MASNISAKHNDVVHVHTCAMFQTGQLLVHETLECAWRVCKTKGHHLELIQPPLAQESRAVLMLRFNFDLVIPLLQVQTGENVTPMQTVQKFVNARNWVPIKTSIGI